METHSAYDETLLFRRQFIMGPRFIDAFPSWRRLQAGPSVFVTAHPDLPVYRSAFEDMSVTLLGYILDPADADAGNAQIVDRLLQALTQGASFDDLVWRTDPLGGRWVLIVDDGIRVRLFTDACGYRQVYHTEPTASAELWCASQPGIIAETMHLEPDGEAAGFIRTYEAHNGTGWPGMEYWWPGDTSLYREIKHLLPNHYLDLGTGVSRRFWPRTALRRLSLEDALEDASGLLRGLISSAAQRFPLALAITAGRDTRLLLAAVRDIRESVFFFTLTSFWNMTGESPDVQVPARLLSRLGLVHHVIHCPPEMSTAFARLYHRNVSTARAAYGPIAEGLHTAYLHDRICMKGNAVPIARARYALPGMTRSEASPAGLAKEFAVEEHPFAIRAFDDWLTNARQVTAVPLMDLFYWEQIEGRWQAMSQLEWDIAQEVFVPYNCRALLETSLAVEEKHRRPPRYLFFEKLMIELWPDVLSVPINPHDPHGERRTLRSHVRSALIKTHLYGLVPERLKSRQRNP